MDYTPSASSSYTTKLSGFEVVKFENFQDLEFRLLFENPLYVSFDESSSDQIKITLTNPEVFLDPATNKALLTNPLEEREVSMPPQIPLGLVASMETAKATTETLSQGSGMILLLNVVAGVGLKQLWKAVNILQFTIYSDDWKLAPPANLSTFFHQMKFFA